MLKKSLLILAGLILVGAVFLGGVGGGIVLDRQILMRSTNTVTVPAGSASTFNLMADAWKTIQQNYVDRSALDSTQLGYGAISGMVDALGDTGHSRFLTPEMLKAEHNFTSGSFEGIGAEVEMKDGHAVIVAPLDGSPAQAAGVHPGDIILKVNGTDVTGQLLGEIVQQILGPAGTQVTITFQDPNTGDIRDVTITRAHITLHNVTWSMLPGTTIAHVRIAAFSDGVTKDLQAALKAAQEQGATGIVLDLRNDPGGLLSEAVGVASQFIEQGTVLQEKNAQGDIKQEPVEAGGVAYKIPMAVLINNGTASAAEIVSGALQDSQRATLVGETTFGTGTVLNEFPLPDHSALLLATEEWLTPKGRVIWHQGITPDVQVSMASDVTPLIPEAEAGMSHTDLLASKDVQLLKSLELLNVAGQAPTAIPLPLSGALFQYAGMR